MKDKELKVGQIWKLTCGTDDELVRIVRINNSNVVYDFYHITNERIYLEFQNSTIDGFCADFEFVADKMSNDEFKALCVGQEYTPNGWISVKNKLPEPDDNQYYLVWLDDGTYDLGRYMTMTYGLYNPNTKTTERMGEPYNAWKVDGNYSLAVTHWQPLPAPPQGD